MFQWDQSLFKLWISVYHSVVSELMLIHLIDGRGKGINMLKDSSNRKRKWAEVEEVKGEEL